MENCDKTIVQQNEYENNKYKTDNNFRLIEKTRNCLHQALNGKLKSSSTLDTLEIDLEACRKWIEWQLTPEKNWPNIEIDDVKAVCMFNVCKDEELKEAFNLKNTQLLLKRDHQYQETKFNFLDYQLQFIKAYQFLKVNEEGLN